MDGHPHKDDRQNTTIFTIIINKGRLSQSSSQPSISSSGKKLTAELIDISGGVIVPTTKDQSDWVSGFVESQIEEFLLRELVLHF